MIRKTEEVFAFVEALKLSTWTAAALGALFESGAAQALAEPRTLSELSGRCPALTEGQLLRCLDVAVVNGWVAREDDRYRVADGARPILSAPFSDIVRADLRSALMQAFAFLEAAGGEAPRVGWKHEDPRILRDQGESSVMIARMLHGRLVPALEGLAERMAAVDGRFLDLGVGVGALAIEMCRLFPDLKVTGLDVHEPALALAREAVAGAQMSDRIELRKLPLEDLRDEAKFDLAWFPTFFFPNVRASAPRLRDALRPGGWVVCALVGAGGSEKENAVVSLVGEVWGGEPVTPSEVTEMLRAGGFSTVRELPSPAPGIAFVGGRR